MQVGFQTNNVTYPSDSMYVDACSKWQTRGNISVMDINFIQNRINAKLFYLFTFFRANGRDFLLIPQGSEDGINPQSFTR